MSSIGGPWLGRALLAAAIAAGALAVIVAVSRDEANGGGPGAGAAATGRWLPLAASPLERTEVGAARIGRFIYVLGGFAPPGAETTDQVARYDIAANSWSLVAPMPIAVNHPGVTTHRGLLYVHGGYTGNGLSGETDALQRYDPGTDEWATLTPSDPPRAAGTLAAVRTPAGGRLYAIGGVAAGSPSRLVEVYEIARDRWRRGPAMKVAREHLASAVVGRRIFVLGGRIGGRNLSVVGRLNTRTGRWSGLPRLRVPRSGFQATTVRGRVVAVGGEQLAEGNRTIAAVELYQPRRGRWRRLAAMRTARHGLGVASRGRRIFALEGGPQPGLAYSGALEFLDVPRRALRGR